MSPVVPIPVDVSMMMVDAGTRNSGAPDESIRVAPKKIDELLNCVGELVIHQTVLNQQKSVLNSDLARKTIDGMAKIIRDVQGLSMGLRMVPFKQTFQKMQRIVRDTSRDLQKDVELFLAGEETEVDKYVLEQLGDPLVHLIRNAVDHGLEIPSERELAGKQKKRGEFS